MQYNVPRLVVVSRSITVRLIKEPTAELFFNKLGACMGEAMSGEYEAVVVDSISEISGRMEDEYASKGDGKLELQDWFKMTDRVKKFSRMLRDLPCHTIVTALTKPTGKEDASAIFEPCLPGQTAAIVPGFFDLVGLIRKGAAKNYLLATDGPSIYQVKDRSHALIAEEPISSTEPHKIWEKLSAKIKAIAATPAETPAQ